ncbi:MAG: NAD(P)-dependent oxidoreductase, partial [Thermomicrobia bacterium]|nr:NAD(P)-dependent oxidoreductase [Thermomicrobia bacterium]
MLVFGGGGQLATDLVPALRAHEVIALTREQLDVTHTEEMRAVMDAHRPDVVINTTAFHKVDLCETHPEEAFGVNAAVPQRIAAACEERGSAIVHVSTDYVFGGRSHRPYREDDPVDPISVYGASKAAGEMAVRATTANHLILRVCGLYGHRGMTSRHGNFVETMLRLGRERDRVTVVSDQILTPSYT